MVTKKRKAELKAGREHAKEAERQRNNMFETMNNADKVDKEGRKLCRHGQFNCLECLSEFILGK